jgi:hypothetical protein
MPTEPSLNSKVEMWDSLQWHEVRTKFHENSWNNKLFFCIVTKCHIWTLHYEGGSVLPGEFGSRLGLGFFLFAAAYGQALGPTQPPIQWVPGVLSPGIKRPGREADHSPASSVEVNAWSYTSTPQYIFMACCWIKHYDAVLCWAQGQLYVYRYGEL